jgi:hypothetical protein
MAETPTDVLVAGYPDIDGATKDFESLGALAGDTQVSIDGVILVTHAPDGSVAVRQTCGNLGRGGVGVGRRGRARGWPLRAAAAGVGRRPGLSRAGHRQVRRPPRRAGHPRPF